MGLLELILVILVIGWLLGWLVFPIGSSLIHVLIVVALIVFIYRMFSGGRRV